MSINATEIETIIEVVSAGVAAAESIFADIKKVLAGEIDPATILARIKMMTSTTDAGDKAAQEILDERFPNG